MLHELIQSLPILSLSASLVALHTAFHTWSLSSFLSSFPLALLQTPSPSEQVSHHSIKSSDSCRPSLHDVSAGPPPSLDRFASVRRLLATSICTPSTAQQIEATATNSLAHSIRAQHLHSLSPPKPISLTRQVGLHLDVLVHVRRNVLASKDASRWDPIKAGVHSGVSVVRDLEQVGKSNVDLEARPSQAVVSTIERLQPLLPSGGGHLGSRNSSDTVLGLGSSSSRSKNALAPFATHRGTSGPLQSRLYSTTKAKYVAKTEQFVTNLGQTYGLDRPVPLDEIMSQLRDIELLQSFKETKAVSARGFKDAVRTLYPLWHRVDQSGGKEVVRMEDLVKVLSPNFTVPWAEIANILAKGKAVKLSYLSKEEKACVLFMRIYNIGRARAKQFYAAGARTIEDLLKLNELGTLKLQESQIIGIRHLDDFERLIPRCEMDELKAGIHECLKMIDTGDGKPFEAELLGSYRRGLDFASDLDLAVRHPSFTDTEDNEKARRLLDKIVQSLEASGLLANQYRLAHGDKKYMGLIKLKNGQHYRRIDIRLGPYDSYPYMLLGGSGDALLMKLMRHRAKARGMCLNEYGMGDKYEKVDQNPNGFRPGTMRIVTSEREIFDLLGVPYLEPHQREYSHWRQKYIDAGIDLAPIS